jgi:putative (di)nucleoside polyphosphate hydrolase
VAEKPPELPPDIAARPYRLGVGVMLFNRDGLVWVGQRTDTTGGWQMPQGGIDKGEDPRAAALREMQEEIGTDRAEIIAESQDWYAYDLPPELLSARLWGGRYRGQKQKWFALRFLGTDADIDLNTHKHPEFGEWKWAPLATLPDFIVPFKRDLYRELVKEFGYLAKPG